MTAEVKRYRLFPSVRLFMLCLAVIGCTMHGGGFGAFNFAIVCMVNETAVLGDEVSAHGKHFSNSSASDTAICGAVHETDSLENGYDGEFAWDRNTQANLLAAHSWGAIWLAVLSGILSDRYGSKIIFAICGAGNVIANVLTPLAAYQGPSWLFAARVVQGLSSGASWPAVMAMVSRWGTPADTSTFVTMGAFGYQLGPLLALASSSAICASPFRWPLIFYLWTALSVAFVVCWLFLYTDDPSKCKLLSKEESDYIRMHNLRRLRQSKSVESEVVPDEAVVTKVNQPKSCAVFSTIPWCRVLFAPAAFSIYLCHASGTWITFFMGEFTPTYSKEILQFDLKTNGFVSTLPQICICVTRLFLGPLADKVTWGGRSKTFIIKIYTAAACGMPFLCYLLVSFLDCRHSYVVVVAFCLAGAFWSMSTIAYVRSLVLVAPRFSGLMSSLSNTCAYVAGGIVMPYAVGAMTSNGTLQQWRSAMWLAAAVSFFGGLQFLILGSGEEQAWAKGEKTTTRKVAPKIDPPTFVIKDEV